MNPAQVESPARRSGRPRPPLQPDGIFLPAQLTSLTAAEKSGSRRLMSAVLGDGVHCYLKYARAHDGDLRQLHDEAVQWIESTDTSWPYSFENLCSALGIAAPVLRSELRVLREQGAHLHVPTRLSVRGSTTRTTADAA